MILIFLVLTLSPGVLLFGPVWPFSFYDYPYNPDLDLKRIERGPPPWAMGNKKNNKFGHGHGNGNGNGHGHGQGHGHGHGHGPPDFAGHPDDCDNSEEFDHHHFTTTQRPPTPLSTISLPPSTTTDYSGLIDIRFKPTATEDRNKRSKGTDPSTNIEALPQSTKPQPQPQERISNSLSGFYPHHPHIINKPYYPFFQPRLSTCIKKFDCIPIDECKTPPRRNDFSFCKFEHDTPYVCCEKYKNKQFFKCDVKNRQSQALIGGTPVESGTAYPWMVAIGENTKNDTVDWYCGGALIGERTVITAAHCILRRNANIIRIGEIDLSVAMNETTESNMQEISVCRTLIHPLYRSPLLYNDIALLYLEDPVEMSPYASPICLPQKFSITETPVALLTGWGQLTFATERSDLLQEVTLKIFNNTYCDDQYALTQASKRFFPRGILDTQLCAGDESGGKDACQGDSGSPLVTNQDGNFVLIGTVSAGIGCGSQTFPGVYTRISSYVPWIFQNLI